MSKKNTSLRLTERDTEYITWIAEQQAVRLDTLQLLFEIRGKKIDPSFEAFSRKMAKAWFSAEEDFASEISQHYLANN
jgi:hypothetical protein